MSTIPIIDISPLRGCKVGAALRGGKVGAPLRGGRDNAAPGADGHNAAPGADGADEVAASIGAACRGTGFFYITGHGLPSGMLSGIFAQARRLFAAPEALRAAVALGPATGNRGHVPLGGEALDPSRPADLKQAFNVGLELAPDDPEQVAGALFRAPNLWPALPGFRAEVLAYFDAVWSVGRDLHRAFAIDLGLPPDFFEDKLDRPMATLRLLHYPARPETMAAGQMGAGVHTDYGNVTLLLTDEVGGLEVRTRGGDWIAAPHVPGALLCNIGDCLMRWTNDTYVSTPHRVVNPAGRERLSVAFFLDPNPEAEVACLPCCLAEGEVPKYPPIRADAYLLSRLQATYGASAPEG
ncbi:MAG: isopenicillin N synthase family oxygenase [Rhodobacteraceae bacterium]|nr:isopenicillin N synthase family oxygenase [Paracoccaceae bacterium]